mmetsp:Transcript_16819/g.46583  ORF Transcript_16819/g.46583 Transcript_16819/m.46583 type:complete len:267 (-) Transcript_16819:194-994(-)
MLPPTDVAKPIGSPRRFVLKRTRQHCFKPLLTYPRIKFMRKTSRSPNSFMIIVSGKENFGVTWPTPDMSPVPMVCIVQTAQICKELRNCRSRPWDLKVTRESALTSHTDCEDIAPCWSSSLSAMSPVSCPVLPRPKLSCDFTGMRISTCEMTAPILNNSNSMRFDVEEADGTSKLLVQRSVMYFSVMAASSPDDVESRGSQSMAILPTSNQKTKSNLTVTGFMINCSSLMCKMLLGNCSNAMYKKLGAFRLWLSFWPHGTSLLWPW